MTDSNRRPARWTRAALFYPACLLVTAGLVCLAPVRGNRYIWLYLGAAAMMLFAIRPGSRFYTPPPALLGRHARACTVLAALLTILVCIFPMSRLPIWNGEDPAHRNQYELMAEAILDGHIDLVYGDEDELDRAENPYDTDALNAAGIHYHWDHAYYDGHYYMYFGIVPVLLVFLPFRVLTGMSLTTYHATQLFTALLIAGLFVLFDLLAKRSARRMPIFLHLLLCVTLSVVSVWYAVAEPALYCTAISAGAALEVWSIYFYVRAVLVETQEDRQIAWAAAGALCGALVFGCRPTIGLANLLVLPLLLCFLRQRKITGKLAGKLVLAALPYVIVAVALMLYNYARFDDPFEFGQRYQLTAADQSHYSFAMDLGTLLTAAGTMLRDCFVPGGVTTEFPYFQTGGIFANFPLLLLPTAVLIPSVFRHLRRSGAIYLLAGLVLSLVPMYFATILMTPYLLERYHMDMYFLLSTGCFTVAAAWCDTCRPERQTRLYAGISALCLLALAASVVFYFCQVAVYYPNVVARIGVLLHLA